MHQTPQIEHRELLELIRENVQDLIAIINTKRERVWFNDAYCNTLGFTRAELESGDSTAKLHPEDIDNIRRSFEEVMTSGRGRALEYRMGHKEGRWIWLESRSRVIENVPGIGKCIILVARNISRRKEQEFQRLAMEKRLQAQKSAVLDLMNSPDMQSDDPGILAWKVAATARTSLACREVSLWWIENGQLRCDGWTRGGRGWEKNERLITIPEDRIAGWENVSVLAFSDGTQDALAPAWRKTGTIAASLQIVLRRNGDEAGIIVCSSEEPIRTWYPDEQSFAESLGGLFLQSLEARERRQTFAKLQITQQRLEAELKDAAAYIEALLPQPLQGCPAVDHVFVPSAELGGDALGYHWIDDDHFAIYLLDVCGHGVGAALLSISALNVLRSHSMQGVDPRNPVQVIQALNRAFEMERQNNMYFTLWYGVWNKSTRNLKSVSAGHPPALLFTTSSEAPVLDIAKPGMVVGAWAEAPYIEHNIETPESSTLLVFSDGVYEVTKPDGEIWTREEFTETTRNFLQDQNALLLRMVEHSQHIQNSPNFDDDVTILRVRF
jgi:PAS domain S-box-containing protein